MTRRQSTNAVIWAYVVLIMLAILAALEMGGRMF